MAWSRWFASEIHSEHDAALCAYLAWRTRNHPNLELIGRAPFIDAQELREGYILHARFKVGLQRDHAADPSTIVKDSDSALAERAFLAVEVGP
jgi:hypothetical protein